MLGWWIDVGLVSRSIRCVQLKRSRDFVIKEKLSRRSLSSDLILGVSNYPALLFSFQRFLLSDELIWRICQVDLMNLNKIFQKKKKKYRKTKSLLFFSALLWKIWSLSKCFSDLFVFSFVDRITMGFCVKAVAVSNLDRSMALWRGIFLGPNHLSPVDSKNSKLIISQSKGYTTNYRPFSKVCRLFFSLR